MSCTVNGSCVPDQVASASTSIPVDEAQKPKLVCPTSVLESLTTLDETITYLCKKEGRFGIFHPTPKLDDKKREWRIFQLADFPAGLCRNTIMLKSIIKHVNSLSEVINASVKLQLSHGDGRTDPVEIVPAGFSYRSSPSYNYHSGNQNPDYSQRIERERIERQEAIKARLGGFVHYLNFCVANK
jgi:hypothetical protein